MVEDAISLGYGKKEESDRRLSVVNFVGYWREHSAFQIQSCRRNRWSNWDSIARGPASLRYAPKALWGVWQLFGKEKVFLEY
ncbi:MAG TPA: hypothetical protein VJR02_18020 [Pyrinomonadaceae bacterium]|nr:hypothetical protein [Pyrinomonadaceae bacterium]